MNLKVMRVWKSNSIVFPAGMGAYGEFWLRTAKNACPSEVGIAWDKPELLGREAILAFLYLGVGSAGTWREQSQPSTTLSSAISP